MVQSHRPMGPSLRSQWLGQQLKQLRGANKFGIAEAAKYMEMSMSTLSRIENAFGPLRRGTLKELLSYYNADEETRELLLYLRDAAWRRDWWDGKIGSNQDSSFADYAWLESRARGICACDNRVVFGLFQTPEYAEAVVRDSTIDAPPADQIATWVELRMRRQEIVTKPNPPMLDMIIDEAALRRQFGGRKVMRAQLERLVTVADLDHVTIRVLPFDSTAAAGFAGNFTCFTLEEPYPDVAYMELPVTQMFLEDPKKLDRLDRILRTLAGAALTPVESVRFIAKIAKDL